MAYDWDKGQPSSSLFGTLGAPHTPTKIPDSFSLGSSFSTPTKLGYLAFPNGVQAALEAEEEERRQKELETQQILEEQEKSRREREELDKAARKTEHERSEQRRAVQLAREREEIQKAEENWVSCGGVLRNERGQRDLEKTQRIREELKLREVEKRLVEQWEDYEKRWRRLVVTAKKRHIDGMSNASDADSDAASLAGDDEEALKFADIPWPICPPPPPAPKPMGMTLSMRPKPKEPTKAIPNVVKLDDLTFENIQAFLLEPLTVRGCKVTKKERVRSSLLRWHPDKISPILSMVDPSEKPAVIDGVHAVIHALHRLNA